MHVCLLYFSMLLTEYDAQKGLFFAGYCPTMLSLGWILPLSCSYSWNIFSFLLDCQDNKYWNRNYLNFEGTFHLAEECVIHIEEWQRVKPAKLIPQLAKNDIAYSQHCLQHMYVPSILDVTSNILHIECTGCFLFAHSDYLFFSLSSNIELWHNQTMFSFSIKWLLNKVSRKCCAQTL